MIFSYGASGLSPTLNLNTVAFGFSSFHSASSFRSCGGFSFSVYEVHADQLSLFAFPRTLNVMLVMYLLLIVTTLFVRLVLIVPDFLVDELPPGVFFT